MLLLELILLLLSRAPLHLFIFIVTLCPCGIFFSFFMLCCKDLKNKILIKNKKLKARSEAEESLDEGEEEEEDDDDEEEEQQAILKFWSPRKSVSKKKVSESDVRMQKFRQTRRVQVGVLSRADQKTKQVKLGKISQVSTIYALASSTASI